ncbi:hypothetical protein ACFFRR_006042 [Megaselia abdita]
MAGNFKSGYFCHKCKKDDEDLMIHCFSCDANFHAGCIGIKGRMIDKVNFDDGFHFYCPEHRKLSVSSLLNKISSLKKLNVQLTQLIENYKDVLDFDPDTLSKELEIRKIKNVAESESLVAKPVDVVPVRQLRKTTVNASSLMKAKVRCESSNINIEQEASKNVDSLQLNLNNQLNGEMTYAEVILIPDNTEINSTQNQPLRAAKEPAKPLSGAPPLKKIVLNGVYQHATVEDVKQHISNKCGREVSSQVHVTKMRLNSRCEHSAFVILPGRNLDLFNMFPTEDFWPENTFASEYDENFRKNRSTNKKKKVHRKLD